MTTVFTRKAFEPLYDELFQQVVQREWVIAASLAAECHAYIAQAFTSGYRDVATACLKRLDDIVNPVWTSEYRKTGGYNGLWKLPEMKSFIAKNLEYAPEVAVDLADGISANTARVMVDGLVRRGIMDPTGLEDGDSEPSLTASYAIRLLHILLDQNHNQAAISLINGLVSAERVESSDFFVDEEFARALVRLSDTGLDIQPLMKTWEDPLLGISSMPRQCGYGHNAAKLEDLQRIADVGAPNLAKYMLLHGSYCAYPIDLCAFEAALGEPFDRLDIMTIGSHRGDGEDIAAIWLGTALRYWLHHQDMTWPYAHDYEEPGMIHSHLAKSPSSCTTLDEIPDEAEAQGKVIKSVFDAHVFPSSEEKERVLNKVLKLYFEGHEAEEQPGCAEGLFRVLPKITVLKAANHTIREKEFSVDLGL